MTNWMVRKAQTYWKFITSELWTKELANARRATRFLYRTLRITVLASRGFFSERARNSAAVLTLVTMLSIAPLLAASFSLAKGLGLTNFRPALLRVIGIEEEKTQNEIQFEEIPEITQSDLPAPINETVKEEAAVDDTADHLRSQIDAILNYVERADARTLGTVGLAVLFLAVLSLLTRIERAFNEIWGIEHGRRLVRRLADYTSVLVICPVLFLIAMAITAPLSATSVAKLFDLVPESLRLGISERLATFAAAVIVNVIGMSVAFIIVTSAFTFLFICVPNTRVRFSSGLTAGVVTGVLWQLSQWIYVRSQVGLTKYFAIYGALASFPIFLIWLHFSWQIILFGAEISFAHQNESEGPVLPFAPKTGFLWRTRVALLIMIAIAERFVKGDPALPIRELSNILQLPPHLLGSILNDLSEAGLAAETVDGERAFVPGRSLDTITLQLVVDSLKRDPKESVPLPDNEKTSYIDGLLTEARDAEGTVLANTTLRQAVDRASVHA